MITATVTKKPDGLSVEGRIEGSTDELIDELACLCAHAIGLMAGDYEGAEQIGDLLEYELVKAIARQRGISDQHGAEGEGDAS